MTSVCRQLTKSRNLHQAWSASSNYPKSKRKWKPWLCPSYPVAWNGMLSITDCVRAKSPSGPGWWFCSALWEKCSLCLWWQGTRLGFQGRKVPGFRLVHPKLCSTVLSPTAPCPCSHPALLQLWSLGLCRQADVWKGSEVVWNILEYCRMSAAVSSAQPPHLPHCRVLLKNTPPLWHICSL